MPENYEKCYNEFKDELEDYIQTKESKVYHYTSSSGLMKPFALNNQTKCYKKSFHVFFYIQFEFACLYKLSQF